ncbi:MAG: hypothetical protein R6W73_01510 [Candidatus Saliniplasma sp.]
MVSSDDRSRIRSGGHGVSIYGVIILSIFILLGLTITPAFNSVETSGQEQSYTEKDEYMYSEKEVYELGEPITIVLENNGEFNYIPLSACLEVKDIDTGEIVYTKSCNQQPAVPDPDLNETLELNQSDQIPEQEGEYRAYLPDKEGYEAHFTIGTPSQEDCEEYQELLWAKFIVGGCILIVILAGTVLMIKTSSRSKIKPDS